MTELDVLVTELMDDYTAPVHMLWNGMKVSMAEIDRLGYVFDYELECYNDRDNLVYCDDIDEYSSQYTYIYDTEECVYNTDDNYTYCDYSNEWYSNDGVYFSDTGDHIARRLLENGDYSICSCCDTIVHYREVTEYNGENYCESCAEDIEDDYDGLINDYHDAPHWRLYGRDNLRYGIEIEIDNGDDRYNCANDLINIVGDTIHLENDGSLNNGFEIITHPMDYDYFMNEFKLAQLCYIGKSYGYRSHNTNTCGLHVHVTREALGDTDIAIDLTLYNLTYLVNKYYDSFMLAFSRRDIGAMKRWACNTNMIHLDKTENDDDDFELKTIDTLKRYNGRYNAINLTNRKTIEFRLFRGSLNENTIRATVQLIHALIDFSKSNACEIARNTDIYDILDQYDYKELTQYLNERNLMKGGN